MADNSQNSEDEKSSTENTTKTSALQQFVLDEYKHQQNDGKMKDTEEIDTERTNNFFARAIQESQRMSGQVEKSHSKMEALHKELGNEIFNDWRAEHCKQVLNPQETEAVERAHQINA